MNLMNGVMAVTLIASSSLSLASQLNTLEESSSLSNNKFIVELGAGAIFLKPSLSDMRDMNARTITMVSGDSSTWSRSVDYSAGFLIEGNFFYDNDNDIHLDWYHLRNSFRNVYRNLAGSQTTIDMKPGWDASNLEFAKKITLDDHKSLRLYAGVQFAHLSIGVTELNSYSTVDGRSLNQQISLKGTPTYNGFGPRVGVNFQHSWRNGACIYVNGAFSTLAGTAKYSKEFIYASGVASARNASSTHVVPEVDTKIGAAYALSFGKQKVTIDAGWMFFNYWSVLNQEDLANLSSVQTTDFSVQGPYIRMKWVG